MADAPTNAGVFGITRISRAPAPSPASSFASGTPAAMEMRQCLPVRWSRMSASTPPTWSGLTAKHQHIGELHHLRIGGSRFRADLFGERSPGGFARITGDDLAGGDESGPNKTSRQGGGHFAGAKKTDGELRGHAGRCNRPLGEVEAKMTCPEPSPVGPASRARRLA